MRTKVIRQLSQAPVVAEGRTVIVEDDYGNPLVVVQQLSDYPPTHSIVTVNDPRFRDVLASLGIDKTVVVHEAQMQQPLPSGHRPLDVLKDTRGFF